MSCGNMPSCMPPPYSATEQPRVEQPKSNIRKIPGNKFFAITTLIGGSLLAILGVVAIIVEAQMAYIGAPIWTGIILVIPTGTFGLLSYWRRDSLCMNIAYLVSSIITCFICAVLFIYVIVLATHEWPYCDPEPGFNYEWSWYYNGDDCQFLQGGRIALDGLIALIAFIQMVVTIISFPFMCYGTFSCCYNCCRSESPQNQQPVQCQLVPMGGFQQPQNTPQSVNIVAPQRQATPTPTGPTMVAYSPQQVLIPASQPQMVQNPVAVIAAPGTAQPAQMATAGSGQPTRMVIAGTTQPAQVAFTGVAHSTLMATGGPGQPTQMVVAGATLPVQQMAQHPSHATHGAPSINMAVARPPVLSQGQMQQHSHPSAFVPAPGIRYRSQDVGTPGVTSTQQQQATVVSQSANAAVSNPQPQLETSQQPPQSDAPVSVGLTASGQFNDQNNLLENAEA